MDHRLINLSLALPWASLWKSETAEHTKKRGKYKTKEKCKRVDTLVDVDKGSETESSDGKDKNMEFDEVMSWDWL